MTLTQAQACASAIIGAGFDARVHKNTDGSTWTVRAIASTFGISSTQITALVNSQGVNGSVAEVEFS